MIILARDSMPPHDLLGAARSRTPPPTTVVVRSLWHDGRLSVLHLYVASPIKTPPPRHRECFLTPVATDG